MWLVIERENLWAIDFIKETYFNDPIQYPNMLTLSHFRVYSFGYGRVEVLSGFVNSLFLIAIAMAVLSEALGRLLDPPDIITDKLLVS